MRLQVFIFKALRKIFRQRKICLENTDMYVQYHNQEANDYIRETLHSYFSEGKTSGLMLAKFGTIELSTFVCFLQHEKNGFAKNYFNGVRGYYNIFRKEQVEALCNNAGFFPNDIELCKKFNNQFLEDAKCVDILASYCYNEKYLSAEMSGCVNVNLNGYYAPFLWKNPWTAELKDKKVLVIHPFAESIKKQYEKRTLLFSDSNVLPEFKELRVIKAVQSVAGNKPEEFDTWFDALYSMEKQIDTVDFDVAIIGCGAYGMALAAYVKRLGKVAIHLAGWTQMLFGIYGNRWVNDQPEFAKYINEHWIRPSDSERPKDLNKVEQGCYW